MFELDPVDLECSVGRRLALRRAIAEAGLTEREDEVLARVYFGGETRVAIARDWGLSAARVQQIEAKAIWRFRRPDVLRLLD